MMAKRRGRGERFCLFVLEGVTPGGTCKLEGKMVSVQVLRESEC